MRQRLLGSRFLWCIAALGLFALANAAHAQEAEAAAAVDPTHTLTVGLDTVWVLITGFLVFWMNAGFGFVESGFTRAKNAVNILGKNFVVFAFASMAFYAVGFGLMFGNGNAIIGTHGFFLIGADNSPALGDAYQGVFRSMNWTGIPLLAKFFFQLAFAGTAATIVSGCVAERIHYQSYMIFAFLLVAVAYPITGHWIWGGGWLGEMHFYDFAGSTVVHSVGGWAGLVGILFLGPRIGKFRADGKVQPIPGHNMGMAFLGGIILWLGWFGFNPGSTMAVGDGTVIAHVVVTTNMACAGGLIAATLFAWAWLGKPDFSMTVNGTLAGLVAITAPCAFVSVPSSILIGAIGGVASVIAVVMFDRIKVDDPVGALAVHLVNGIWGTLSLGLFANTAMPGGIPTNGVFVAGLGSSEGWQFLGVQALGVAAVGAFTVAFSVLVWLAIKATFGMRVSPEHEAMGLDMTEMGMEAYAGDSIHGGGVTMS